VKYTSSFHLKILKTAIFPVLFFCHFALLGQNINKVKYKTLMFDKCIAHIDSAYILPSSLVVFDMTNGNIVSPKLWSFNFATSSIVISDSLCAIQPVLKIRYVCLDIDPKFFVQKKDTSSLFSRKDSIVYYSAVQKKPFQPYDNDGLMKQGSISRGISAGNTRGASLQSSLDIRLSGKLNNDVEIIAVITDNNIPVQPDGNTQQLQEFDKVFIELKKNTSGARFGDIDLASGTGHFMKYNKKTQGGLFYTSWLNDGSILSKDTCTQKASIAGGISKGKFARNSFVGMNGNQGPYKLTGAENEMFIVVLAGTEKVYINGELMTRGQNYDYVIDYNLAEITFSSSRLITGDQRIVVEFEYSDKNYVRSLFTGNYEYSNKKTNFKMVFYSEQDARNQPLQQEIDENDIFILQMAGDNPLGAVVPGWDSIGFSGDYVMYAMIDSLGLDSIFLYSIDPTTAIYKVSFSFVGKGKGNYMPDNIPANGRVFKWIAPVAGIPQGDYEPYIVLIPPQKKQMFTAAADHQVSKNTSVGFEFAVSNTDMNTFSSFDNNDNSGVGAKVYFRNVTQLRNDSLRPTLKLIKLLSYEFTEARFNGIDRYRAVEFERDWNLSAKEEAANDHIFSAGISLASASNVIAAYQAEYYVKAAQMNGFKNRLNINMKKGIFHVFNQSMYMTSDRETFNTDFLKQKGRIWLSPSFVKVGMAYEHEINVFKSIGDSLMPNSYSFLEFEPFLESPSDSSLVRFRSWYKHRNTQGVYDESFKQNMQTKEVGSSVSINDNGKNTITFQGAYRLTEYKDTLLQGYTGKTDQALVGRLEHQLHLFKGSITSYMYYEIGSGMEAKKDFTYIEVAPGQGQYTWNDYNGNGIKEIDEFELSVYQDEASYIRIILPSNDFVKVFTLQFNETFVIEPSRAWRNDTTALKKCISRFSNRLQFSLGKKTQTDEFSERFLPISGGFSDSTLISMGSGFSNTFFFNRAHPVYSGRYRFSENINKAFLINGFELRRVKAHELQMVWNISPSIGTEAEFRQGTKENDSEFSIQRRYTIEFTDISPKFHYQTDVKQRYSIVGGYRISDNTYQGGTERAVIFTAGPEFRFPIKESMIVNLRCMYHDIEYNGISGTPLAYEMLESLEAGVNFTWNIMLQYSVSKALQLSFIYDGRQPQGKKMIHFGSIQLKALL
jgi:hypothetical protein